MEIIDTHAHIDQLEDLEGAMKRAHEAGLSDIVAMSVDLVSMKKLLEIKDKFQQPKIHPAFGIHPGLVSAHGGGKPELLPQALDFLKANISQAAAVGETGLDYWYKWVRKDEVERNKQKDSFSIHLKLAKEHNLPIVIHSRGAWEDCLNMALEAGVKRALFHWYSGPVDIMEKILAAGFYLSTSISVAYSPESRRAMAAAPIDRILVETDSPVSYKEGETVFMAEPKDVVKTWKALSQLKHLDENQALEKLNANARGFFGI